MDWQPYANNFRTEQADFKWYSVGEQLGLLWTLYKLRPDLVHFTMPQQPYFWRGRSVTTIHDLTLIRHTTARGSNLVYWLRQQIFKQILKKAANQSAHILCDTNFVADDVAQYFDIPKEKVTVAYNSADTTVSGSKAITELEHKEFIFYVGNAFPYKNLPFLIDVFAELKKEKPHLHLALAGKKEHFYNKVQEYVDKKGIGNVHILGFVSDEELGWLYQNAQCYVFPSLSEGFGLPGLETMLNNLPVASSNATCLPEVYGQAAKYFDPTSIEDAVKTISELLDDPKQQKELIVLGKKQLKKYSWEKMTSVTHQVYLDALEITRR